MKMRSLASLSFALALVACGSAPPPASTTPVASAPPPVEVSEPVIQRAALDEVLDAGLGAFLGRVTTAPSLDGNHFVVFQLVALRDADLFAGVDLQPGDVIMSVNGQSIERPDDAFTAWTGLRVASEITIAVLRDGQRRDLRFPIVD
jgi:type II secretory pathway component PulC